MRKAILLASILTTAWVCTADARTGTPSSTNAQSTTEATPPVEHPAVKTTAPTTPQKPAHKAPVKTTSKPVAPANTAATPNTDPCSASAAANASPDTSASNDTSIQCHQDKSKPMQGGLVGH